MKKLTLRFAGLALISCLSAATLLAKPPKKSWKKTIAKSSEQAAELTLEDLRTRLGATNEKEFALAATTEEEKEESRGDFDTLDIGNLTPPDERGGSVISGITHITNPKAAKPGSIPLGEKPNIYNPSLHTSIEENYQLQCIDKGWVSTAIHSDAKKEEIAYPLLLEAAKNHIDDSKSGTPQATFFSGENLEGNPAEYKIPVRAGHIVSKAGLYLRKKLSTISQGLKTARNTFESEHETKYQQAKYNANYTAQYATKQLQALDSHITKEAYDTVYKEELAKNTRNKTAIYPTPASVQAYQDDLSTINNFLIEAAGGIGTILQKDFQALSDAARIALGLQGDAVQDHAAVLISTFIKKCALENNKRKKETLTTPVELLKQEIKITNLTDKTAHDEARKSAARQLILALHHKMLPTAEVTISLRKGSGSTADAEPILNQLPAGDATVSEALHQITAARYFGNQYDNSHVPAKTVETGLFASTQKQENE